ncbi:MAG: glycoside hydrolase [Sphingomonas bacterium]|uniref:glycoside hydrolase n=1 Tax=Sphingomonas bacterium TaxID=1895847 RepID=UPI002612B488|nr:glycoside hydrolase [Sphingomonas bacterium]MDB5694716.1 glycoside hydrolase [Sphingomonas bacterium]
MLLRVACSAALLLEVGAPPPADPFYTQHLDAAGLPVIASPRTPAPALAAARDIVTDMLARRPDLARWLVASGYRVAVMAPDETTTDLPEQRGWVRPGPDDPRLTRCERKHYATRIGAMTDRQYWNARARGMSGPLTSAGAENLLALPGDRYRGENILVHELAHDVLAAIRAVDPRLYAQVERAYADALKQGRWKGEYASTTIDEYWAVGTQFHFNSGRLAAFDKVRVLSHSDLARYDPALASTLLAAYGARHRLTGDRWWNSPARVPPGPLPKFTAEVC